MRDRRALGIALAVLIAPTGVFAHSKGMYPTQKAALEQARPTILEPIMNVEVTVPDDNVGDVMGDLSSRRGRVQASEAAGSNTSIRAQVPMGEMLEYASSLTSLTGGKGEFHMEFSHYDEIPSNVRDKIIEQAAATTEQS